MSHYIHTSAPEGTILSSGPSSGADSSRSDKGIADRDPTERHRPDSSLSAPFSHIDTMIEAYQSATNETERRLYLRGIARGFELVTGQLHDRIGALVDALTEGKK